MPKFERHLIYTADERTWKFDRPVIFLGEWARVHNRKDIWQNMDAIVAEPYGLGQIKKDCDNDKARDLEEKIFPIFCDVLNLYHGTRHSKRYWKIVLGHWFQRYITAMINRIRTIEVCMQQYLLSGTTIFDGDYYSLAVQDSYAAILAYDDPRWNAAIYARIISLLNKSNFQIEVIADDNIPGFCLAQQAIKYPLIKRIVNYNYQRVAVIAGLLLRTEDIFILNSYLPKKEEIKLHLALGQMPMTWKSASFKTAKLPDRILRQNLSKDLKQQGSVSVLSDILQIMLFEVLPVCYLEGFQELNKKAEELPWPNKPKLIFTSNCYDTDELFKVWTATKVVSGSKYIIGQHGNNYGTYRYFNPSLEETIADKFLTWGWVDGLIQHTPTFLLKTAGLKQVERNWKGGLLLIEDALSHRISTWDNTFEFGLYFKEQQVFIRLLDEKPRKQLTLRLHAGYRNQNWCEEARWYDFDPLLKIDKGSVPINQLISRSRLVVHSYDSTGILETLSQNIPTIAFWSNGLEHLRESAMPYYQLLLNAGIIHLTPQSAAKKINEIWEDIDGWWMQGEVQLTVQHFCENFARTCPNPVSVIKQCLLK